MNVMKHEIEATRYANEIFKRNYKTPGNWKFCFKHLKKQNSCTQVNAKFNNCVRPTGSQWQKLLSPIINKSHTKYIMYYITKIGM